MVSSTAIAAAEGFEPEEKPPLRPDTHSRKRREGPWKDDLEERIGSKNFYTINEIAALADRSPATIFRLLRLGRLPFVQVGGRRLFSRRIVLDFLRRGTPNQVA
jgi:excisionase family DNA binding protein